MQIMLHPYSRAPHTTPTKGKKQMEYFILSCVHSVFGIGILEYIAIAMTKLFTTDLMGFSPANKSPS
jgi:hypothetical protein